MGGLISLIRDIKTVYKDLKVTLKLTARIVLKVHSIVEDVEQTVQELKATVKKLTSRVQPQDGMSEIPIEALVENVESKAISLKTSLINATSQVFNDDLLRKTQEKWDMVMQYSRESSEALANIVASSSLNVKGKRHSAAEKVNSSEQSIFLSELAKNDSQSEQEGTSDADRAVVPVFCEELHYSLDEEEIRDFEILPLDVMDSFWKCDIGCINIDCVDFHQLATSQQASTSLSRKKNSKNRSKNRTKYVKGAASGFGSSGKISSRENNQTPARYNPRKGSKQRRETVALELIFLAAILVEGLAMSDSNVPVGENMWGDRIRSNWSHSGEIIELDD